MIFDEKFMIEYSKIWIILVELSYTSTEQSLDMLLYKAVKVVLRVITAIQ